MKMQFEFVEHIPPKLSDQVVYISIPFATAVHLCACGCGFEVVTPLSPTNWRLIYDGESVSLDPSIGNWSLACRSHYWIDRGSVQWAERWSNERILFARSTIKQAKPQEVVAEDSRPSVRMPYASLWKRFLHRIMGGT